MSAEAEPQRLSAEEIIEWSKRFTIYDWAVQSKVSPIPVVRAKGVYFYDADGKRYLDFNSQLMCVNIATGILASLRRSPARPNNSPTRTPPSQLLTPGLC